MENRIYLEELPPATPEIRLKVARILSRLELKISCLPTKEKLC